MCERERERERNVRGGKEVADDSERASERGSLVAMARMKAAGKGTLWARGGGGGGAAAAAAGKKGEKGCCWSLLEVSL